MQMEKALINDRLNISKVSREFCIPTIYNFAIIYPWNLLFSSKVSYFLAVSTVVYKKKTLQLNNLKTRAAMNAEISVFVICVEAIIYFILYNLHTVPLRHNVMLAWQIYKILGDLATLVMRLKWNALRDYANSSSGKFSWQLNHVCCTEEKGNWQVQWIIWT